MDTLLLLTKYDLILLVDISTLYGKNYQNKTLYCADNNNEVKI